MNEPDQNAYYLMQIAWLVRCFMEGFSDRPRQVDMEDLRLKFEKKKPAADLEKQKHDAVEAQKAAVRAWLFPSRELPALPAPKEDES
jgi:hypothetical protein